ncbi:MAG: barstar family protein [Formosimonas sp.]
MAQVHHIHDAQLAQYLTEDTTLVDWRNCAEPLAHLAQRLNFPDYFGGNLDALYDILSERIELPHTWILRSNAPQAQALQPILETFEDALAQADAPRLTVVWWRNG